MARIAMTIMSHLWCLRITVIIGAGNLPVWAGQNLRRVAGQPTAFSGLFFRNCGAHFKPERIEPDETRGVTLIVGVRRPALHRRDVRVVKTFGTLPPSRDDVSLVKLEPHETSNITLSFGDQRLQGIAFRCEPKTVVNQFAIFG